MQGVWLKVKASKDIRTACHLKVLPVHTEPSVKSEIFTDLQSTSDQSWLNTKLYRMTPWKPGFEGKKQNKTTTK
jgi:hypothetical protein